MSTDHLAFVIPSLGDGGSNRFMMKVAGGLADKGFAVDLIAIDPRGQYAQEKQAGVRRIDLGVIPVRGITVLKSIWSLNQYIRNEKPAVVMGATTAVNVLLLMANLLAGKKTKVVVSERNAIRSSAADASKISRFYRHLIPLLYPNASRVVAVSRGVGEELVNHYGIDASLVSVIYNPVISPELVKLQQQSIEEPWFNDRSTPVILAVGRLHPQKDFATLIRGFALLRKTTDAKLLILGEGRARGELEQLAVSLGISDSLKMPGFVENPYAYMERAQLFVMTSIYEGICNVIIEAMACGCPVVSTDCPGGGPREILEDGKWGALVDVGKPDQLAEAMRTSLSENHDRDLYRQRAGFFSVEKGLNAYQQLFSELA